MTAVTAGRLEDLESLAPVWSPMVEHHHQVPWTTSWRKRRRVFAGQFGDGVAPTAVRNLQYDA
jgi:hypothetical protein